MKEEMTTWQAYNLHARILAQALCNLETLVDPITLSVLQPCIDGYKQARAEWEKELYSRIAVKDAQQ